MKITGGREKQIRDHLIELRCCLNQSLLSRDAQISILMFFSFLVCLVCFLGRQGKFMIQKNNV